MGIFDFWKGAGAEAPAVVDEAALEEAKRTEAMARYEELLATYDREMSGQFQAVVESHGFSTTSLRFTFDAAKNLATVSGAVDTQEIREKIILLVGNTKGVAQVDDRLTVSNEEPASVFHTVQKGDTLSKIAKANYGDAMKYPLIFEANRPMLKDQDLIYPGQVLRIPALRDGAAGR
ncbi:MAG: peptidoglycan-binding protein LysM [Myxococcales bacterium]|nr:peptidoglycan-binding protein LysM [Myxococcales bacterium]